MGAEKVKSKRQTQRGNMRRKEARSRQLATGAVILGAVLIAAVMIFLNLSTAGNLASIIPASATDVILPTAIARPAGDGLTLGDPGAPVRIDVFEDFQCPACKRFTETVEHQVLAEFVETGKAYYVFHNYAFLDRSSVTKESQRAALAGLCANEQGKFWEYHDTLFANWNGENQGAFSDVRLGDFAASLSLDTKAFDSCMSEGRYVSVVDASFDEGNTMGVQGTPSVFVNGVIVKPGYVPSFADIAAAVEAAQP